MIIDIYVKMYSLRHSYENLCDFFELLRSGEISSTFGKRCKEQLCKNARLSYAKKMDLKMQKARGVGIIMSSLKTAEE